MKRIGLWILSFGFLSANAQVPSFGAPDRIDLASWNLMWYGHPVYGSTNKSAQRSGIGEVLRNAQVDIWFFQELCDTADFSNLLMESGPFQHVYARYWQSQKTAWVWDSTQWTLLDDSMVLEDFAEDFASGRLPLLAVLKAKNSPDTLFLLGIHLKANTGTDTQKQEAWYNRKASADHLFNWQEGFNDRKVIIAGDWNDGMDTSVYRDTLSPFIQLRQAGLFLLEKQALAGEKSWYYGSTCIDHLWANTRTAAMYRKASSQILPMEWYFSNYPTEVSDHFPVFAALDWSEAAGVHYEKKNPVSIWPNPSSGTFYMDGWDEGNTFHVVDMLGKAVMFEWKKEGDKSIIHIPKQGIYTLFMQYGGQVFVYRLVVNP